MRSAALLGLIAALPALAPPASAQAAPVTCTSAESKQFDFWVGKWNVAASAKPDVKVAESLIEKLYGGCAVRENWMPLKGNAGGSLNAFVPATGKWRQTWVDPGGFADFTGGWNGKAMVIQGVWPQPGKPNQITRMTYTPLAGGAVEQKGETTDDNGKTWQPSFSFLYTRKPA
jgi:hypothetical protein